MHLHSSDGDLQYSTMHLTSLGHHHQEGNKEPNVTSQTWEDIIFSPY